jgi:hypothetical protein
MRCIKGMLLQLIGFSGAYVHFIQPVLLDVMIIVVGMAFRNYIVGPYILADGPIRTGCLIVSLNATAVPGCTGGCRLSVR